MKSPESLAPLVDCGVIDEVLRPLMSGKEAQVYIVLAGGNECVAKVYKEASQRTFKHRSEYTEGRRSRNTRDQRAVTKRTRHGRKQDEAAWRNTEVDMIFRLRDAGVRVPEPINFLDGVLVMELVQDAHGNPAPRLGDLEFEASEAEEIYQQLIREVVRMLCAGVIHGDLSDFNVLMSASGPVVIDFPQSVDPAHNRNARKLLVRDVENLHRFVSNFSSKRSTRPYAEEMWELYESNRLAPDTELTGGYRVPDAIADTDEVLALIDEANREERGRRAAHIEDVDIDSISDSTGGPVPESKFKPTRAVVDFSAEIRPRPGRDTRRKKTGKAPARQPAKKAAPAKVPGEAGTAAPKKRRARRTPKTGNQSSEGSEKPTTTKKTAAARPRRNASPSKANADKREVAPRESDVGKGRRRRSRGRGRSRTEGAVTGAKAGAGGGKARADANTNGCPRAGTTAGKTSGTTARTSPRTSGGVNRPAKPAAGQTARRGQGNREATKGSDAPRRRRRRRPRTEGS